MTLRNLVLWACAWLMCFPAAALEKPARCFIRNAGQVRDQHGAARNDIDFTVGGEKSPKVFIGSGHVHYQWAKKENGDRWDSTTFYRLDMELLDARLVSPTTENPSTYQEVYYFPHYSTGVIRAEAFGRLVYRDIYPGIDWVLYFTGNGALKYDFIVRPGARPSDIRIKYKGASKLLGESSGGFKALTPFGSVQEQAPVARELESGRAVATTFRLDGDLVSFDVAPFDGTLLIDPVVEWASYYGGADIDLATAVATDPSGAAYLAGTTSSATNIATTGAHQQTYGGGTGAFGNDAFVAKFNGTGDCLWATYYGGSEEDAGMSLAVDTAGSVYLSGFTAGSAGLATTGAFQPGPAGGYDAFLVKFDSSGQRLWATYVGGTGDDFWGGPVPIACDRQGNVYLAGTAQSTGLATPGAQQVMTGGYDDAVLVKFSGNGNRLWSTYLGGAGNDYGFALAIDTTGSILMGGSTNSPSGIATGASYQPVIAGEADGFLAKYTPTGVLLWSTYFGGSEADYIRAVAADDSANIFITGITASSSGIATPGAQQPTYGGGYEDAFLARLSAAGQPAWSTYYGGADMDEGLALKVSGDNVYLAGLSSSPAGIATPDGLQPMAGGDADGLVARFDRQGNRIWGSYYGGADWDQFFAVDADTADHVYMAGFTVSATGIATPGAHQSAYSGGYGDGFLLKIKDCSLPATPDSILGPGMLCAGATATYRLPGATNAVWLLPPGWTGTGAADSIVVAATTGGVLLAVAVNDCGAGDTSSLTVTVLPAPVTPLITRTGNTLSVPATYDTYQWLHDNTDITGATAPVYTATLSGSYTVRVSGQHGCTATAAPVLVDMTGISERLLASGIEVFPNPFVGVINIRSKTPAIVTLHDLQARLIRKQRLPPGDGELRLEGLAEGAYLLRISDTRGNLLGQVKLVKVPESK